MIIEIGSSLSGRAALFVSNGEVRSLRSDFLSNVGRHPNALALSLGERTWSYSEVDELARRWAGRLLDAASGRPCRVGLFASRSETAYVGVLAILLAGAAFVPLNRKFPIERTRFMLEQADVDVLLVDAESLPQVAEVLRGMRRPPPVLLPDTETTTAPYAVAFCREDMARAARLAVLPEVEPDDVAYLLFTSGSTGRPKGVPITHRNVVAFLDESQRRYGLTPADRLSQTFDQTFDLSIFDLFMAWSNGACVCSLRPIELLAPFRFLEKHRVTVWFSVPSVAAMLQQQNLLQTGSLPTLRWSLFCGEALPRRTAEAWQAAAPGSIVENLYGPTELTIACAAYRWDAVRSPEECAQDLVPIGRVFEGLSECVVDDKLELVPPGASGELCVAGPQTFRGYWHAPELTSERVLHGTGPDGAPLVYYRTGDLVRQLPSGNYAFLGRNDHQVKIGGYRIELGEIEAMMRRAGCIEAAALPWPSARAPTAIVAFATGATDAAMIEESVRGRLPSYMVPRAIHVIEQMPLNANGKIDREALSRRLDANGV